MSPLLAELAGRALDAAVAAGRSSLDERGFLDGDTPTEDLAAIVAFRTEARVVAIADGTDRSRYYYELGGAVLEEDVDGDDHAFTLRSVSTAAAALADAADPAGCARDDGPLVHRTGDAEPAGWGELERAVAAADSVLRIYVVARADEQTVQEFSATVASTPNGVWLVSGHGDPATGDREVWGRRLGRASLETALAALLGGPVVQPA